MGNPCRLESPIQAGRIWTRADDSHTTRRSVRPSASGRHGPRADSGPREPFPGGPAAEDDCGLSATLPAGATPSGCSPGRSGPTADRDPRLRDRTPPCRGGVPLPLDSFIAGAVAPRSRSRDTGRPATRIPASQRGRSSPAGHDGPNGNSIAINRYACVNATAMHALRTRVDSSGKQVNLLTRIVHRSVPKRASGRESIRILRPARTAP